MSAPEVDVRCAGSLGESAPEAGRCQLLMGHEHGHAVMFSRGEHRLVRTWDGLDSSPTDDHEAEDEQRPWAPGYPTPTWADDH